MRDRRSLIEQTWLNHHATWTGQRVQTNFKSDMFQHHVPAARRAVERFVTRLSQQLLPTAEFFEVFPTDDAGEDADVMGSAAEAIRAFMLHLMTKRIRIRSLVKQLGRTFLLYNRAIAKTSIQVIDAPVRIRQEVTHIKQAWPTARAVDPFVFYVWPETVTDAEDAQVLVEDMMMPWDQYVENAEMGVCEKIERRDLSHPTWPTYIVQRLGYQGITEPSAIGRGMDTEDAEKRRDEPPVDFVAMSEVWFRSEGRWKQTWLVWNVPDGPRIVRYKATPMPKHPYRMSVARAIPGQQYTTGMMDDLYPMQGLLDDQINLALEGQAMSMSGIAAIDPDMVARSNSIVWRPRAKWLVKPDGVKFLQPPDVTDASIKGMQMILGFIDSFSGSTPLSEGTPPRGMPRAGFAASTLTSLAMADIRDVAQTLEEEILSPMLSDLYTLAALFIPRSQLIRVPGSQNMAPKLLTIEDFVGEWAFQWVGSLQSQDMQVKAQRMVAFLGVMGKIGPTVTQDLAERGKRLNWELLLKRMWRDSLGERGADSIITQMSPEEIEAMKAKKEQSQQIPMKGSVSLKGDLSPEAALDLVMDGRMSPQAPPAQPKPPSGGATGPVPKAPVGQEGADRQMGRAMAESSTGRMLNMGGSE